jgi:trimeric autotransporter adhesin
MASSLGACTGNVASEAPPAGGATGGSTTGGTGGSGTGGSGGTGATTPMLQFTPSEPLSAMRGKEYPLEVQVYPVGFRVVRFALLPGPGGSQPGDAALSGTDVSTDELGRVTVTLTAPTAPTTFLVRASSDGFPVATREVTVPTTGKASLLVEPDYSGERVVTTWYAAAVPNRTCAEVQDDPFDDDLAWASSPGAVELPDLTADTKLAVMMRADHFASGCVTFPGVVEGVDNRVTVPVTNVAIQLAESEVSISLDLAGFQAAFQTAFEPSIVATLAAVGGDDVAALLDRMQAEADAGAGSFVDARSTQGWDAAVRTALGSGAATALRGPLERWMRAGLANTSAGRFIGTLGAEGADPEGALLTLDTVAGLPPDALGVSAESDATWYSSLPVDEVFFGATLTLDPSLLLLGGALAPARTEVDGSATLTEALTALVSCDAVAAELVVRGVAAGESFAGCDEDCTRSLCASALETLSEELEALDVLEPFELEIAGAATAKVGPEAELVALDGTWVGQLAQDGETTGIGGVVLAPAP